MINIVPRIARRYAAAALAAEPTETDRAALTAEVEHVAGLFAESSGLRDFAAATAVPRARREAILHALFAGRVSGACLRLLRLLERRRRLTILPALAAGMRRLRDQAEGIREIELSLARDPAPGELDALVPVLERKLGVRPRLRARVRPDLLGGLQLRAEDRLYDDSVATRLRRLRERMHGAVIST